MEDWKNTINKLTQLTLIEYSTKEQQAKYSFQLHREHLPKQTSFWATKQGSRYLETYLENLQICGSEIIDF